MRISRLLYTITVILALHSCADNTETPAYTVGETDNAITLSAGVSTNDNGVQTRATSQKYTPFSAQTQLRLRVDGKWTNNNPSGISKTTTAKTSPSASADSDNDNTNDTHTVEFTSAERLYWDDYGTADPGNQAGRAEGLTIYGVAVEGSTSAPEVSDWNSLSWTLPEDQNTDDWKNHDLITSNNIRGTGNTLKFDDVKNNNSPKNLLIFTHAMSKITVNLKADEGFPGYDANNPSNATFEENPTLELINFNTSGTYDVLTKTPSASSAKGNIKMHLTSGGKGSNTAQFDALMFPGNSWDDNTKSENILQLNADGNIYQVKAEKLYAAMTSNNQASITQGYNYILNITVKKTKIEIEATIKNWEEITSENVAPEINISASYGQAVNETNAFTKSYDFFRSLDIDKNFDSDSSTEGINPAAKYTYSEETQTGSWDKTLFWPNHETHYFFRGVYPQSQKVETVNGYDVISVKNCTFSAGTSPSELMIALPRSTSSCSHGYDIEGKGICATTGKINMNFEYAMSKIELRLTSNEASSLDYVDLTNAETKVEIINGYENGYITLKNGLHSEYQNSNKKDYPLSKQTTAASGFQLSTLDAIMPQQLSDDVVFKITVKNSDGTTDIYTAQINKIKEKNNNSFITEWEHGKHYIYILNVTKTKINVSATLSDWTTVSSSENVWM